MSKNSYKNMKKIISLLMILFILPTETLTIRAEDGESVGEPVVQNVEEGSGTLGTVFDGEDTDPDVPADNQILVRLIVQSIDGVVSDTLKKMIDVSEDGTYSYSESGLVVPSGYGVKFDTDAVTYEDGVVSATFTEKKNVDIVASIIGREVAYSINVYTKETNSDTEERTFEKTITDGLKGHIGEVAVADVEDRPGYVAVKYEPIIESENTVAEVTYVRNIYTLSFNTNGGSYVNSISDYYNTEITINSIPICGKEEHKHSSKPTAKARDSKNVTSGCYTSQKVGNSWTWVKTCGFDEEHTHSESCFSEGQAATPYKQGCTFVGWCTDAECTELAPNTIPLTENITLYAKWDRQTVNYIVIYQKEELNGEYSYVGYSQKSGLVGTEATGDNPSSISGFDDSAYYHYEESTSAEIKADGSTIVYSKYNLNTYKILFDVASNSSGGTSEPNAVIDLGGYHGNKYIIEAKLGEDISAKWPTSANISGATKNFYSWKKEGSGNDFVSKRFEVTKDMLSNTANGSTTTYKPTWANGSKVVLHYMLQNADNNNYTDVEKYGQEAYTTGGFNAKTIYGFTYERSSSTTEGGVTHYKFYYKRNTYDIEYFNGSAHTTKKDIRFGKNINTAEYNSNPTAPQGYEDYDFGGWYEDADFSGERYTFDTMPAYDLALYAKWLAPEVDINVVVVTDEDHSFTFKVRKGDYIDPEKQIPEIEGYVFDGLYTDPEYTSPFNKENPITGDMTIYAKMKKLVSVGYVVRYVDADGALISFKGDVGYVGNVVSSVAVKQDGYEYVSPYRQSLTLTTNISNNVMEYICTNPEDFAYVINYTYNGEVICSTGVMKTGVVSRYFYPSAEDINDLYNNGYSISQVRTLLQFVPGDGTITKEFDFPVEPTEYTITYLETHGETGNPATYTMPGLKDNPITLVAPTWEGHEFLGWELTKGTSRGEYDEMAPVISYGTKGNLTFTALWSCNSYTITYDLAGGETTSETYVFTDQAYGSDTPTINDPTKLGYKFTGWNPAVAEKVTKDAKYTAQYELDDDQKHTLQYVIYYYKGSTLVEEDTFTSDPVTKQILTAIEMDVAYTENENKYPGYTLDKVNSDAVDSSITLASGVSTPEQPKAYNIRYTENGNVDIYYIAGEGGTVSNDYESLAPATGTAEGSTAAANTGYHFVNWTKGETVVSTAAEFVPATVDGLNVAATYTANFAKNLYEIEFVDEDGTPLIDSANYEYGTAAEDIVKPDTPTKAATDFATYEFAGWSPAVAEVTQDQVYVATYEETPITYNLIIHYVYDEDGREASPDHTETLKHNDAYSVASPTITNYIPTIATVSGTIDKSDVEVTVVYEKDIIGGGTKKDEPDDIPDKYEVVVKYDVVNGAWNDETTATIYDCAVLTVNGEWDVDGEGTVAVPSVGNKPNAGYKAGSWDHTPSTTVNKNSITSYTYTYDLDEENTHSVGYIVEYYKDGTLAGKDDPVTNSAQILSPVSINGPTINKNKYLTDGYMFENTEPADVPATIAIDANEASDIRTIKVNYTLDVIGENDPDDPETDPNKPDTIPDKYQIKVNYKVVNGSWNDESTADKVQVLTLYLNGVADKNGTAVISKAPGVGNYPKAGYKAGSWDTDPTSVTLGINNNGKTFTYTYIEGDEVLIKYEHTEGGNVSKESETVKPLADVVGSTASANTGYHFVNWTKNGTEVSVEKTFVPEKVDGLNVAATYTANFKKNQHRVIYYVDGELYDDTQLLEYGDPIVTIAEPTKEGYTFTGWENVPETLPDEEVVINGHFRINHHDLVIHYVYEDGSKASNDYRENKEYASSYSVATPTISGYTADKATVSGTMPDNDVVVTVTFKKNSTPTPDPDPDPDPPVPTPDPDPDPTPDPDPKPDPKPDPDPDPKPKTDPEPTPKKEESKVDPKPTETVETDKTPTSNLEGSWALINLICVILSAILAIITFLFKRTNEDDDDEDEEETNAENKVTVQTMEEDEDEEDDEDIYHRRRYPKWVSLLATIISAIVFIFTEDMRLPMVMVDKYTIINAILALASIIMLVLGLDKKYDDDEEDEEEEANVLPNNAK